MYFVDAFGPDVVALQVIAVKADMFVALFAGDIRLAGSGAAVQGSSVVWRSAEKLPIGKSCGSGDWTCTLVSGAYSSPIVLDGRVYLFYYLSSGTVSDPTVSSSPGRNCVTQISGFAPLISVLRWRKPGEFTK